MSRELTLCQNWLCLGSNLSLSFEFRIVDYVLQVAVVAILGL